ncbi:MAG TPA: hypothetical protein PLA12_00180 [Candidatus Hydrogenedens sp.]|nr:hypothetical protein [Candidatus Hydrogenedens sp.]
MNVYTKVIFFILFVSIICPLFSIGAFAQTNENTFKDVDIPKADVSFIFHFADKVVDGWLAFLDGLGRTFDPIIRPIFRPITTFLERTYQPWAKICALGLFIGTMLWVWFGMPKEYVNLGRKNKTVWTDLRFWTIISMLPHIIVYFYF